MYTLSDAYACPRIVATYILKAYYALCALKVYTHNVIYNEHTATYEQAITFQESQAFMTTRAIIG